MGGPNSIGSWGWSRFLIWVVVTFSVLLTTYSAVLGFVPASIGRAAPPILGLSFSLVAYLKARSESNHRNNRIRSLQDWNSNIERLGQVRLLAQASRLACRLSPQQAVSCVPELLANTDTTIALTGIPLDARDRRTLNTARRSIRVLAERRSRKLSPEEASMLVRDIHRIARVANTIEARMSAESQDELHSR